MRESKSNGKHMNEVTRMSTPKSDLPVVVGVDRSDEAIQALRFGLLEARSRACGLLLVHTFAASTQNSYFSVDDVESMHADGVSVLEEAVAILGKEPGPAVPITTLLRQGPAGMILGDLSSRAQCIVVGRRNSGWGERLLTGSVSSRVSAKSQCAVVMVPHGWNIDAATMGPVVVAIDGKSSAYAALLYAFCAADQRQADLVVLHAAPTGESKQDLTEQDVEVAEVLAGWRSEFPDVAVTTSIVHMKATLACENASRDASLLVLGRSSDRHLLPWTRTVAHAVLKNARCPIVTVPLPGAASRDNLVPGVSAADVSHSLRIGTY